MIANPPFSKVAWACVCALAAALLSACASEPQTVSSQDSSVDFSGYRTYAFLADLADDQAYYQSLDATYLKQSVSREMNARGFEQVSDDPDLVINFSVETQEKVRSRQVPTGGYGVGYDPFYDVYYDGWGATHTTQIDQFTEGKLNIDAIDVESRKLVWQGSTKGRITRKDEQNWQQTLDNAVVDIFTQFPVPVTTSP
jgi:hypothetical protein